MYNRNGAKFGRTDGLSASSSSRLLDTSLNTTNMADIGELWLEASKRYADICGMELKDIPMPRTTAELLSSVERQNKDYKHFREKSGMLFNVLSAAVKPIELVGNLAAGAASAVFAPSSMCFGAVMYLIGAARGVSASLDAITELLGSLQDITTRLEIYNQEELSQALRNKLAEILVTVIEVFAISTKVIKDGAFSRLKVFGKNLLVGNDTVVQGLMDKLDRLVSGEDRLAGAETLVQTKRTGRNVEAVQMTLMQTSIQLEEVSISQNSMAQGVGQILNVLEAGQKHAQQEKSVRHMEAVKRMLKPSVSSQDRFDEIRRERIEHSGEWICSEAAYTSWTMNRSPILWVSGIPGSGKSFLTYTMITDLQAKFANEEGAAGKTSVGFAFFRDNKDQTRSIEQALRDIAFQIAQTDELYAKYISENVHSDTDVSTIRSAWQRLFVDFFLDGIEQTDGSAFVLFDGMDESFTEGREIFLELLKDIEAAGCTSRLRVAMLGRPHIMDEIADRLEQQVLNIHVSSDKNGADILQYVESSIAKSRVLQQLSRSLKIEIIQSLSAKADGMFMWARLMLAELSKKSRVSAIRDALNGAPKGLTEMLRHVLAGVSASIKDPQDAEDLNDLLMWVTLAQRPILLGELDAMLRLKSPEGEGVLNLEVKLRVQFASFFALSREDALTTADLLGQKRIHLDGVDEDARGGAGPDELDDLDTVEHETEFNSNPVTTSVTFVHASISDFFKDPKQGKISGGGDAPAVGVAVKEAAFAVLKTCLTVLIDNSMLEPAAEAVTLNSYAVFWPDHLVDLDPRQDHQEKAFIATTITSMLRNEDLIEGWSSWRGWDFFTKEKASTLLAWLLHPDVVVVLPDDALMWLKSCETNPLDLFEQVLRYHAQRWLGPGEKYWKTSIVSTTVCAYVQRRRGVVIDEVPSWTQEQITVAAEWAGFEQTANWHSLLAVTMRENGHYDCALEHFNQAIDLDPQSWYAKLGVAKLFRVQDKVEKCIKLNLEILEQSAAENDTAWKETSDGPEVQAHESLAECYEEMADAVDQWDLSTSDAQLVELVEFRQRALRHWTAAFRLWKNPHHIYRSVAILHFLANPGRPFEGPDNEDSHKRHKDENKARYRLEPSVTYLEHVMAILQDLDDEDFLTECLMTLTKLDAPESTFCTCLAEAANATRQMDLLQDRYRQVIAAATRERQHVTASVLSLYLAELYAYHSGEPDKAIRIWEYIGTEGSGSTKLESEIAYNRQWALNQLGKYCLGTSLSEEAKAEQLMARLERIVFRTRQPTLQITSSDIPRHLAFWYRKCGRVDEARQLVRSVVKDSILVLSDDDPSNDAVAFYNIARVFVALGDVDNYLAASYPPRGYKNGIAVLEGDQIGDTDGGFQGCSEPNEHQDIGEDDLASSSAEFIFNADEGGSCDGPCKKSVSSWDNMTCCLICGDFCQRRGCHKKLLAGESAGKSCSERHGAMFVPALEAKLKAGETLLGDRVITLEEWKDGLKRAWGL